MFRIPGEIIALLTFPGIIVHELAHQFFCRLFNIAIYDVCYFRYGNPAGFVVHEHPKTLLQHFLVSVGPFLINSILGALISAPAAISVLQFESGSLFDKLLIWLGVSIAMHAFPSIGDAVVLEESVSKNKATLIEKLLIYPAVHLIYLGSYGSIFWLDIIYGIFVAGLLPKLVISLLL